MLAEKIIAHLIKREQVGRAAAWRVGGGTLARTTSTSVSSWAVAPGGAGASMRTAAVAAASVLGTWMCAPLNRTCDHTAPLQVLLVVAQPERDEGELAADYARRLQNERVLALNPNYSAE